MVLFPTSGSILRTGSKAEASHESLSGFNATPQRLAFCAAFFTVLSLAIGNQYKPLPSLGALALFYRPAPRFCRLKKSRSPHGCPLAWTPSPVSSPDSQAIRLSPPGSLPLFPLRRYAIGLCSHPRHFHNRGFTTAFAPIKPTCGANLQPSSLSEAVPVSQT